MIKRFLCAALVAALLFAHAAEATNLCNVPVTTAVTGSAQTAVPGFGTPTSLSIQGRFTYVASSATSVDVYIQTTIDGNNWIDIADFHWTTSSVAQLFNVNNAQISTPATITDGGMTANTSQSGVLGAQYRCKVTTSGTYGAGTAAVIDVYARY